MGIALRPNHPNHLLLYSTFAVDAVVVAFALYCASATDSRWRSTRKRTLGPCANPECSRQVFFNVNAQEWLHWGGNFSATCIKKLDTTAAPANPQDYSCTDHLATDMTTSLGQMRRGEGTKVRPKNTVPGT